MTDNPNTNLEELRAHLAMCQERVDMFSPNVQSDPKMLAIMARATVAAAIAIVEATQEWRVV
jgi:hypothetical protein